MTVACAAWRQDTVALDLELAMSTLMLSRLQAERLAAELSVGMTGARKAMSSREAALASRDRRHDRARAVAASHSPIPSPMQTMWELPQRPGL
jgi:hypothetical protein